MYGIKCVLSVNEIKAFAERHKYKGYIGFTSKEMNKRIDDNKIQCNY